MTFYGVQLPLIIIAVITAFVGYQFNFRAKRREVFLKEISNSYNEVYFPMYELLRNIELTEEKATQLLLLDEFFKLYRGHESKVRFIGTWSNLEYFYEFELAYKSYKLVQNRSNEIELFDKFKSFNTMIHNEFWEAHAVIYEDHLKFKSLSNKNPFVVGIFEIIIFLENIISFLVWVSVFIIYVSICNHFAHWSAIPVWWNISNSIVLFFVTLGFWVLIKSISSQIIKKNRKKLSVVKVITILCKKISGRL
ncbi:hypothetical protein [Paenibacillus ferrarius]|uniref:hypothetical protein n=1 Tax=Paenibacillus ferrarius TaxID=1469647 RepID=UPI003D2CC0F6